MPIIKPSDDYEESGATPPEKPEEDAEPGSKNRQRLPKSILMGKTAAVGDELMLKITGIFGDEIEVEYPESEPEAPEEEEAEQPPEEAAAEGGDAMEGEGAPAMASEDAYA